MATNVQESAPPKNFSAYEAEDPDPIVAEVRRAREALLAKHNYDIVAMMEDARRRQRRSGHKVVSFAKRKR